MLPLRENLRELLTDKAVKMTIMILAIIVMLVIISMGGLNYFLSGGGGFEAVFSITGVFGLTVAFVLFVPFCGYKFFLGRSSYPDDYLVQVYRFGLLEWN